jgi:CHAD domain-containing protein
MESVRRELAENLGRAVRELRSGSRSDPPIHDIRRRLKYCRALLRLLRKPLGKDAYRRENARLRDAARPMTPMRDAAVLVKTLDGLCARLRGGRTLCRSIRAALRRESRERRAGLRRKALLASAREINGVAQRVRLLPRARLSRVDTAKAVKCAYRTGRRAMTTAEQHRSRDSLHEWRKQVKYLANEMKSLLPSMRKGLHKTCKQSDRLADRLGADHDLALLHDKLIEHRRLSGAVDAQVDALLECLAQRRARLQRKAFRRGKRLFAMSASRLEARIRHGLRRSD